MAKTWNLLRQKVPGGKVLSHIYIDNTEPGQNSYMAGELLMTENDWLNFSSMLRKAATDNLDLTVQVVAADIKSIKEEDRKKLLDLMGKVEGLESGLMDKMGDSEMGLTTKEEKEQLDGPIPDPPVPQVKVGPTPHSMPPPMPPPMPPVTPMKFYPAPPPKGESNDPKTK